MLRLLAAIVVNASALLATTIVPGISFNGGWLALLFAGTLFGLFNLIVRPIATLLSLPALILSLGLFYFILNGFLLWTASLFLPGYRVSGVLAAILGGIVMTVFNWAVQALFKDHKDKRR